MARHGRIADEEANVATYEAAKGAVSGASRWGIYTAIFGVAAYGLSPIYRGLTIQFKVFLQMSGMIIGGMIEADRRLREYEARIRRERRMAKRMAEWERFDKSFELGDVGKKGG